MSEPPEPDPAHRGAGLSDSITITDSVKVEVGRGVNAARLTLLGVIVSVAIGAAGVALTVGGAWWMAVLVAAGSVAAIAAVLRVPWSRHQVMRFAHWLGGE